MSTEQYIGLIAVLIIFGVANIWAILSAGSDIIVALYDIATQLARRMK